MKQLCLALADLVLQMPQTNDYLIALLRPVCKHHFGSISILSCLKTITSLLEEKQTVLLTLMTVIPEEYRNKNLRLGDRRRNQVYEEFEKVSSFWIESFVKIVLVVSANSTSDSTNDGTVWYRFRSSI